MVRWIKIHKSDITVLGLILVFILMMVVYILVFGTPMIITQM
jgi:hypothetical protein